VGRRRVDGGEGEIRVQCALCRRWYRAIHYSHLKSRHGWSGPDAPQRYKERFGVTFLWFAASRFKLGRSIVRYHDRIGRKWSREAVLEEVRARAVAGKPMHLTAVLAEGLRHLVSAATIHLGSWGEACRAAGIEDYQLRKSWTREKVLAEIQSRYRAGMPMFQRAALADHRSLVTGAKKCIGRWTEALRLAGVPPELRKEKRAPFIWTRERIIEEIRRRREAGQSIAARGVSPTLYQAGRKRFGGWSRALEAAGLGAPQGVKELS